MSVALIEPLVEMTATLNVVVLINSTTVMQTYWTAPFKIRTVTHWYDILKEIAMLILNNNNLVFFYPALQE